MDNESKYAAVEMDREKGKLLYFSKNASADEKRMGVSLLIKASTANDPEAQYIVGRMLLDGVLSVQRGDSEQAGIEHLHRAASNGWLQARAELNAYCRDRYEASCPEASAYNGPLKDFDGKVIRIDHSGFMVPVDARLDFIDGRNILTFSLDLSIIDDDAVDNQHKLYEAIVRGIKMWEGDYTVFGGQNLSVRINITLESKLWDSVTVLIVAGDNLKTMQAFTRKLPGKHAANLREAMFEDKRSMAIGGLKKWSVRSRKWIYLNSESCSFDDYDEISQVIKHEFGHVLGLGDLYEEAERGLPGVKSGSYDELDSYLICDKFYNLVMCDHHGPISNNDIEMVVLAFSENRMQEYQNNTKKKNQVSKALGRGN